MKSNLAFGAMVVIALTCSVGIPVAAQDVTRTYQKFDDYTEFKMPEVDLGNDLTVEFSYICTGNVVRCHPRTIVFFFAEKSSDWQHLDDNSVTFLLDGHSRIRYADVEHNGTIGDGYVLEFRQVLASLVTARRIANSGTVEGQWSLTQFTFPPPAQENLRALVASTTEQGP